MSKRAWNEPRKNIRRPARASSPTTAAVYRARLQGVIRLSGMTHVRTSPFLPAKQRPARTLAPKRQAGVPPAALPALAGGGPADGRPSCRTLQHAPIAQRDRLPRPANKLAGRETQIFAARDRKLEAARQLRQAKRAALSASVPACASASPASLTTALAGAIWFCPVKQRRALLKSNRQG